jgi:endonuclease G, mitochondrial
MENKARKAITGPRRLKSWLIIPYLLLVLGFTSAAQKLPVQHLELSKPDPQYKVVIHNGYTLAYNSTCHLSQWVAYELTADETTPMVKRSNRFVPDPLLVSCSVTAADYKSSGFDMGHLAPAADMCYSVQAMDESFFLSNMAPQQPEFNRGIWEKLEDRVRQWARDDHAVYVVTGPVLTKGLPTIGRGRICVPGYFFKVILDYTAPDIKGIGFIMPNLGSQEPIQHFAVPIDSVEKVTGIDFFYQLPDDQERAVESTVDLKKWNWKATLSK